MDDDRYDPRAPRADRNRPDVGPPADRDSWDPFEPDPDEPDPYRPDPYGPPDRDEPDYDDPGPYEPEPYDREPYRADARRADAYAARERGAAPRGMPPYDRAALRRGEYRRRSGPSWPLVAGGAAVLLLGVVAGLLLFSDAGGGIGAASPTPGASATVPGASPASSPTEGTAGSTGLPGPGPVVSPPEGFYPPGSVARASVDALRIRTEPGTDAPRVTNVSLGGHMLIRDVPGLLGPVEADGLSWYPVEYAGGDDIWPIVGPSSTELSIGWTAAGLGGEQYLELVPVSCSGSAPDLRGLANMTAWERLACLSGRPLTVEGTFAGSDAGTTRGTFEPRWLTVDSSALSVTGEPDAAVTFHVPPDREGTLPAPGTIVRATLHLDDAAAATCSMAPEVGGSLAPTDPEVAVFYCRQRLVLDSFEELGVDPNFNG